VREISGLQTGEWYRFDVRYATTGIANAENAVLAVIQWANDRTLRALAPARGGSGETQATLSMQLPENSKGTVTLHLFAGFIPNGHVDWLEAKVSLLPGEKKPTRPVRVAVIDSRPAVPGSVDDNARHYSVEIDKACAQQPHPDIILLPENFNVSSVKGDAAVALDSAYIQTMREAARRNRVYVTGSIREQREGTHFNTAVLIDREGRIAGRYSKAHLTIREMLFSGLSRGDEFKVFQTDFGKVGVLICWDFHFPEAARAVALRGADLLLVPMAADGRLLEGKVHRGAEYSGKAFVLENRIPVVFAATWGATAQPSLIIDQHAAILARSSDAAHIISATLDLDEKAYQWSSDDFQTTYKVGRRPELYGELSRP
jgi:predicted amidohydrolase